METLNHIMEERNKQLVYEANRKYNYEQMLKQYYIEIAKKQFWIIVLLMMIIGCGTFFTFYWIRQRNRRMETQRNIDTLQEMNRELESTVFQKQLDLRKNLLWRFEVCWEMLALNQKIKKPDSIKYENSHLIKHLNKIMYGKIEIDEVWEALLGVFNEVMPGLAIKVREKYPNLTESEFRISLLYYAGFTVNESALILKQSPNTIQARRSDLRRKMGLDIRGDIVAHIDHL